jgi:glycosyltransferase involved in cell wall biosynthesis
MMSGRLESIRPAPRTALPQVTVVMPLFNKYAEVPRGIRGILTQTVADFELLIVNDGSTDGSEVLVRQFADSRVRLINQANAGESAARNKGIAEAAGDLIAFCDADDEWKPGFLEQILSLCTLFPQCDVFGTRYTLVEPSGVARTPTLHGVPDKDWRGVLSSYFAVAGRSDPPFCASSVAARRAALEAIGGFPIDIEIGGDLLTWARLGSRYQIAYAADPHVDVWLRAPFGAPPGGRPKRIPDRDDAVGTALASMLKPMTGEQRSDFKRFIASWHRMRAEMFLRLDERANALKEVGRMSRYSISNPALYVFFVLACAPKLIRRFALAGLAYATRIRRR